VANNGLPFGTEIRIPELFGEKVFSVQDRMHWRKGGYHFDIWFPTYEQSQEFRRQIRLRGSSGKVSAATDLKQKPP